MGQSYPCGGLCAQFLALYSWKEPRVGRSTVSLLVIVLIAASAHTLACVLCVDATASAALGVCHERPAHAGAARLNALHSCNHDHSTLTLLAMTKSIGDERFAASMTPPAAAGVRSLPLTRPNITVSPPGTFLTGISRLSSRSILRI